MAGLRLTGELAFLSACDTAAGSVTLPDEAIHLAAAVQAAGYRHVVATLWQIGDDVAPSLTETVYGPAGPGRAAGRRPGGEGAARRGGRTAGQVPGPAVPVGVLRTLGP